MSIAKLRTLSGALFKSPPGISPQFPFPDFPVRLFGVVVLTVSAASLQLVLVQGDEKCELDDDLKELAYYGLNSGAILQITKAC